ncbi:uncharacterized protein LOC121872377 isoform X2 [Homarus americanus]|uniref:uncharacterized protein LOC121872377 isoform X2 n=1 Tax=Homarus americanus TaxID=6706 RepID=UPI001C490767|nr:uncharacterized protein LOC121872377 isoform X2 [Homarus americanus]
MFKYLLLATLLGGAYAEGLTQEEELYIVAGILGGVCLLLTIASIYNTLTIISLQSKVAVLQATGSAVTKVVSEAVADQRRDVTPPLREPYGGGPAREEHNRRQDRSEDNFRRQPTRDNFRMERPAPPPRPINRQESRTSGYY